MTAARLALAYLKSLQAVGVIPKSIGRKEIMRWDFVSPTPGLLSPALSTISAEAGLHEPDGWLLRFD